MRRPTWRQADLPHEHRAEALDTLVTIELKFALLPSDDCRRNQLTPRQRDGRLMGDRICVKLRGYFVVALLG